MAEAQKVLLMRDVGKTVISQVKKGDYVFIQFGHNDEKKDSHVTPFPVVRLMIIFVDLSTKTRAKGSIPVYSIPLFVATLSVRTTRI